MSVNSFHSDHHLYIDSYNLQEQVCDIVHSITDPLYCCLYIFYVTIVQGQPMIRTSMQT